MISTYFLYFLVVMGTFLFMEAVAWAAHKYIMHGLLWSLHEDHHQKRPHFFEKNDLFFVIFATPSLATFYFGATLPNQWLICIGFGIMLYGFAYFMVHDVIIHQRFKWFSRSNNLYVKAIRRAHKMHHKHLDKEDGESFGMLIVSPRYWNMVRHRDRTDGAL